MEQIKEFWAKLGPHGKILLFVAVGAVVAYAFYRRAKNAQAVQQSNTSAGAGVSYDVYGNPLYTWTITGPGPNPPSFGGNGSGNGSGSGSGSGSPGRYGGWVNGNPDTGFIYHPATANTGPPPTTRGGGGRPTGF